MQDTNLDDQFAGHLKITRHDIEGHTQHDRITYAKFINRCFKAVPTIQYHKPMSFSQIQHSCSH